MLVPTKERLRPMNQTQQTDGVSELEIKVHNYLKYLIVEKDLSFEKDDYDERIDEEGSMRVMNSMNDKNPKYYWDCVKELTALLTQQAVELEKLKLPVPNPYGTTVKIDRVNMLIERAYKAGLATATQQAVEEFLGLMRKSTSKQNELCKRDNQVLSVIRNYFAKTGKYPSFRVLARLYGSTSRNVEVSVQKLRKLGYLENTPKIALSQKGEE